jgi:hypothetical protein
MAPLVTSTPDLQWSSYEDCYETRKWSQSEGDDIDMDNSPDFDDYSESLASSSSFLFSSISGSTGSISAGSYASDVGRPNDAEQTFENCARKEIPAIQQGPIPAPSYGCGAVDGCIDPRLMTSDSMLAHEYGALRNGSNAGMKQVSCSDKTTRRRYNDPPKPALLGAHHPIINDFDIAFDEMQVTMPSPNRGVRMWLHTWVATNPDRFPDKIELESLKILSALSESEIMAWLSQHVSTQLNPMAEPMDSGREETPRQIYAPRYRPKCRRSRRRVRYIADAQDETKMYECTHGCGQAFTKKGQWTRHERYNLEEWRCHLCKFISARKDKLLKHLREGHSLRSSTKKFHCRQLLQPSARLCGFCLKQFDDWSIWLNHVGAHFEGHIAGGPWTMARWNKAVDQDFGSNESDDDDDDDDEDDYNNGNDEDQTDHDFDNSAAGQAGDPSSKNKGSYYERGSQGSSRSSGSSKSTSSGNGSSKSSQRASGKSSRQERGHCTQFGVTDKIDTPSHTVSILESSSPGDLPLDGGEFQGLLPSKNLDLSVHHSQQQDPSQDSFRSHGSRSCKVLQNVEWSKHRETITRLYKLENKSLREVEQIMAREYGLRATPMMYKKQFIKWDTMPGYSKIRDWTRPQGVPRRLDRDPKIPSIINCVAPASPLLAHSLLAPSDSISRHDLVSRRPSTGYFCVDTKIHEPGVSEAFDVWRSLDSGLDVNFVQRSIVDELNFLYPHPELSVGNALNLDLADDERLTWYSSSPQGTLGCHDMREIPGVGPTFMAGADSPQVNPMEQLGTIQSQSDQETTKWKVNTAGDLLRRIAVVEERLSTRVVIGDQFIHGIACPPDTPDPACFAHLSCPPISMTFVESKASRRRRSPTNSERRSAQTICEQESCLPCWCEKGNCLSEDKAKTTEDCQRSRNKFYEISNRERPHVGTGYQWCNSEGSCSAGPKVVEDQSLLSKASGYSTVNQRGRAIDEAYTTTFKWLTEPSGTKDNSGHRYTDWLSMKGRGLLWIKGSPGSGKSNLTKHLLKGYGVDTTTKDPYSLSLLLDRASFFHLGMLNAPGRGVGATWLKRGTVKLQPRTASFDTIRRLFGAKDRAHLERFKIERFLNDPDGCNSEHFLVDGMESCAPDPDDVPEMSFGINMERLMQDHKPSGNEDVSHCAAITPQGFHGEHELQRHTNRHHITHRKVWICKDSSARGSPYPTVPLANCKACCNGKPHGANYDVAAHLRRVHFSPCKNRRGGRGKSAEEAEW